MATMSAGKAAKDNTTEQSQGIKAQENHQSHGQGPQSKILGLQQSAGNRAIGKMLKNRSRSTPSLPGNLPPIVKSVISSGGQPLDPGTRTYMESRFGEDFKEVRVHIGAHAIETAEAINADAYTIGNDISFDRNLYNPTSLRGKALLAHELAHVVQQRRGGASPRFASSKNLEQAAQRVSETVVQTSGEVVQVEGVSGIGILREKKSDMPWWKRQLNPLYQKALESLPDPAAQLLEQVNEQARQLVETQDISDEEINAVVKEAEPAMRAAQRLLSNTQTQNQEGNETFPAATTREDLSERLEQVRQRQGIHVLSTEETARLEAERRIIEHRLHGSSAEEKVEYILMTSGLIPGIPQPPQQPENLPTRSDLEARRNRRLAEQAHIALHRQEVEQVERERIQTAVPSTFEEHVHSQLARAGIYTERRLTNFEIALRSKPFVRLRYPHTRNDTLPVPTNGLRPLYDDTNSMVIGYYSTSAGADLTIVDVNGVVVQQGDKPITSSPVQPDDLLFIGLGATKVAQVAGRHILESIAKRCSPKILRRLRNIAAAAMIGTGNAGAFSANFGSTAMRRSGTAQIVSEAVKSPKPLTLPVPKPVKLEVVPKIVRSTSSSISKPAPLPIVTKPATPLGPQVKTSPIGKPQPITSSSLPRAAAPKSPPAAYQLQQAKPPIPPKPGRSRRVFTTGRVNSRQVLFTQRDVERFQRLYETGRFASPNSDLFRARVAELHRLIGKSQGWKTTAMARVMTPEGERFLVASSDKALTKIQRSALREGEMANDGMGHAEKTLIERAMKEGWELLDIVPCRDFCVSCYMRAASTGARLHRGLANKVK